MLALRGPRVCVRESSGLPHVMHWEVQEAPLFRRLVGAGKVL